MVLATLSCEHGLTIAHRPDECAWVAQHGKHRRWFSGIELTTAVLGPEACVQHWIAVCHRHLEA